MAKTLLQNNKKIATATRSDMVFRPDGKSVEEALQALPQSGIRELLKSAGATYNAKTGLYSLYPESGGLTDLTEAEMLLIYNTCTPLAGKIVGVQYVSHFYKSKIRTNLSFLAQGANLTETFAYCGQIEVVNITGILLTSMPSLFFECMNLRRVIGYLDLYNVNNSRDIEHAFYHCTALQDIELRRLKCDISFKYSSQLNKNSILNMVKNNDAKSNITITLHPQAFAVAMADAEIQAALTNAPLVSLAQAE